jgi:hypothetical protein
VKLRRRGSLRGKVQGQPAIQCDVLLDRKDLRVSHLYTIVSLRIPRNQELRDQRGGRLSQPPVGGQQELRGGQPRARSGGG